VRGASTISQQVVKNLFLWPGQSWFRKGLEAGYTLWLELVLPKERILEIYVNIAEFGYGVYGAEAAAQRYFDKPASKLTRSESALMAVVLPNPKKMKLDRPGPYMRGRQAWVLRQM
jgi:monofunctional biosynthetic peptidoglycan transglycosylase